MSMRTPADYAKAFFKNCPGLRPIKDEKDELIRLFQVAMKDAKENE